MIMIIEAVEINDNDVIASEEEVEVNVEVGVNEYEEMDMEEHEINDQQYEVSKGKRQKLSKSFTNAQLEHIKRILKNVKLYVKFDDQNEFYKTQFQETFPKIAVMMPLTYRKIKFIEFSKEDMVMERRRRFPWLFDKEYTFPCTNYDEVKKNGIYRLCMLPCNVPNDTRKVLYFFTENENKYAAIRNGLVSLESGFGCASWRNLLIDLNATSQFDRVRVICICRGMLAAFRCKMEAVNFIDERCGNIRKCYITRTDATSWEYFSNCLEQAKSSL